MTVLGQRMAAAKQAPAAAPAPKATRLAAVVESPRGESVVLPVIGDAWIQLAGSDVLTEVTSAVLARMAELGLDPVPLNGEDYGAERTKRILAWSVRNPDNHAEPLGTLEEWGKVDADVMMAAGAVYMDVRARLDPVSNPGLTDDDLRAIISACEKKNLAALMSFGVGALAIFLLTTASQPSSSQTPPSSSGESSP